LQHGPTHKEKKDEERTAHRKKGMHWHPEWGEAARKSIQRVPLLFPQDMAEKGRG